MKHLMILVITVLGITTLSAQNDTLRMDLEKTMETTFNEISKDNFSSVSSILMTSRRVNQITQLDSIYSANFESSYRQELAKKASNVILNKDFVRYDNAGKAIDQWITQEDGTLISSRTQIPIGKIIPITPRIAEIVLYGTNPVAITISKGGLPGYKGIFWLARDNNQIYWLSEVPKSSNNKK